MIAERKKKRSRIDFKSFSRLGSEQVEARGVEIELRDPFAQRERENHLRGRDQRENAESHIFTAILLQRERGGEESS